MKAVQFGAGNIGKGFIGYLLNQSGYELCFVDIAEETTKKINHYGEYTVVTLGERRQEELVDNIKSVHSADTDQVIREIVQADLITTSIGAGNLSKLGPILIEALRERMKQNPSPMDIIACENALFATDILRKAVYDLADDGLKAYLKKSVSFPNCTVDRIVPNLEMEQPDSILIYSEEYAEWNIEKQAVKANFHIRGANYVTRLDPFLERKLFMLNGAHSVIAYLGRLKGYEFIHEAIKDAEILAAVVKFQEETSRALSQKHGIAYGELEIYADKIRKRFKNHFLKDDVNRVGADPLRKLSGNDRLASPLKLCFAYKLPIEGILQGMAAGYLFDPEGDMKAQLIQSIIRVAGIAKAVEMVSGLSQGEVLNDKLVKAYEEMKERFTQVDAIQLTS